MADFFRSDDGNTATKLASNLAASATPKNVTIIGDASSIEKVVIQASSIIEPKMNVEPHVEDVEVLKAHATLHIQTPAFPKSELLPLLESINGLSNSQYSSKAQSPAKIPSGPKFESRRPSRNHGMVVRFIEGGPKNGKRNIILKTRVSTPYGSKELEYEWTTTQHYPGAVIMARENQQGSASGDAMPFLNIQRGDILILKEQRSPNIYLVKQKRQDGLEGLIRIFRIDMKAGAAAATSIQGDDSQSEKAGNKPKKENSHVSRACGHPCVLKNKTNISGRPSPSKLATGTTGTKEAINPSASAFKLAAEAKAPRVPAPGFENSPHMIAARSYDEANYQKTKIEYVYPKRFRYSEIWTPFQETRPEAIIAPGTF